MKSRPVIAVLVGAAVLLGCRPSPSGNISATRLLTPKEEAAKLSNEQRIIVRQLRDTLAEMPDGDATILELLLNADDETREQAFLAYKMTVAPRVVENIKADKDFMELFEDVQVAANGTSIVLVPTNEFVRIRNAEVDAVLRERLEGIDFVVSE